MVELEKEQTDVCECVYMYMYMFEKSPDYHAFSSSMCPNFLKLTASMDLSKWKSLNRPAMQLPPPMTLSPPILTSVTLLLSPGWQEEICFS